MIQQEKRLIRVRDHLKKTNEETTNCGLCGSRLQSSSTRTYCNRTDRPEVRAKDSHTATTFEFELKRGAKSHLKLEEDWLSRYAEANQQEQTTSRQQAVTQEATD